MKFNLIAAIAAASLLCTTAAHATASASAEIRGLRFTLTDLDAQDGITPWLQFANGGYLETDIAASQDSSSTYQRTPITLTPFSTTLATSTGSLSASLSGDAFGSGADVFAQAQTVATLDGIGFDQSFVTTSPFGPPYGFDGAFTLSPHTQLTVSGYASVSVSAGENSDWSVANVVVGLEGSPTFSLYAVEQGFFHAPNSSFSDSAAFELQFANDSSASATGDARLGVFVTSATFVPEPSSLALILASLAAIGIASRRRTATEAV